MTDKIIFVNTRGFLNKKDRINAIVKAYRPIALVIAEHFRPNSEELDVIEGYKLTAVFCRETRERGGVAIFVREEIDYVIRTDLNAYSIKKEFEVVSVEIVSRNLVVTAVYRPPTSKKTSFNCSLETMLKKYNQEPLKCHVMAGDFNIDNSKRNSTQKILAENGFKFLLNSSTHDYGACLDNFVVDFDPSSTRVLRAKIDKLSDHNPIELILPSSRLKTSTAFDVLNMDPWTSYRTPRKTMVYDDLSDSDTSVDYCLSSNSHNQQVSQLSNEIAGIYVSKNRGESQRGRGRGRGATRKKKSVSC